MFHPYGEEYNSIVITADKHASTIKLVGQSVSYKPDVACRFKWYLLLPKHILLQWSGPQGQHIWTCDTQLWSVWPKQAKTEVAGENWELHDSRLSLLGFFFSVGKNTVFLTYCMPLNKIIHPALGKENEKKFFFQSWLIAVAVALREIILSLCALHPRADGEKYSSHLAAATMFSSPPANKNKLKTYTTICREVAWGWRWQLILGKRVCVVCK